MAQKIGDYFSRVARNGSFRRGLASAGAGALIAAVTELAWPTKS